MAKKSAKNMSKIYVLIGIIALALALVAMVFPMFVSTTTFLGVTSSTSASFFDMLELVFDPDLSIAFDKGMPMVGYLVMEIVAVASIVLGLLAFLGGKSKALKTAVKILAIVVALFAIVALIFSFVYVGDGGAVWTLSVGAFPILASLFGLVGAGALIAGTYK